MLSCVGAAWAASQGWTEVAAASPVLAVSAVAASGGRLASVVAVTTVVASDVPTSYRWLAKDFEPAALAAASSVIRSSWVPSASTIRASPSAFARSISAAPSSLVRHA